MLYNKLQNLIYLFLSILKLRLKSNHVTFTLIKCIIYITVRYFSLFRKMVEMTRQESFINNFYQINLFDKILDKLIY